MSNLAPLNYSTQFLDWFRPRATEIAARGMQALESDSTEAAMAASASRVYITVATLLSMAEHFMLPEGGRVMDDTGKLLAKYSPLLKLPYPVTAFEFSQADIKDQPLREGTFRSTKRIALCIDAQTARDSYLYPIEPDEWICMSINYVDALGVWAVVPAVALVSNTRTRFVTEADLKLTEQVKGAKSVLPVGTEVLDIRFADLSQTEYPIGMLQGDLFDELTASVQAVAALNCENVTTSRTKPPADLNRRRVAKGKAPFFSYHVLECTNDGSPARGPHQGGTHASPRSHLRRGHIRRLSETRSTWVRASMVGSSASGIVKKDYRIARAS